MCDVSIIIPTFNRLWSLPRAIESCKNSVCNTEIIVIDDGSTDGTWDWLMKQNDLIIIKQKNQGQTYAINQGVTIAKGKYIRFLDSDDFLKPEIIDKQFISAEFNSADLIYSRVDTFVNSTNEIIVSPEIKEWDDFMEIQLGSDYGSHFLGMLFKTEIVKKTPRRPDFAFREDRMFLLEYGLWEPKIFHVNECAGYWVKHDEQMQANYRGLKSQITNWQHLNIYKRIIGDLQLSGKLTIGRRNASCTVLWAIAHWISKEFPNEAKETVDWIYDLNPEFKIPDKGLLGFSYKTVGYKFTQVMLRLRRFLK